VQESYAYDADGTRVSRKRGNVTTIYFGGLVEQEGTTTRTHYAFNGQVIAQREGSTVIYLHGDHLGSISVATSSTGAVVSKQEYTPWGAVRSGGVGQTTLNYTGQRRDGTGLLFYGARYYDPGLARFVSADSSARCDATVLCQPILYTQALYPAEVSLVVGNHHQPMLHCGGSDQNIGVADKLAASVQVGVYAGCLDDYRIIHR
jgi:RHS repeat-associated protein